MQRFGKKIRTKATDEHEQHACPASIVTNAYIIPSIDQIPYAPFEYKRRETFAVDNIGDKHVPVVIADLSKIENITPQHLESIGYTYNEATDKWNISDAAADYIFTGNQLLTFALPGTLKVIVYPATWQQADKTKNKIFSHFQDSGYVKAEVKSDLLNFVMIDCFNDETSINDFTYLDELANDPTVVLCLSSTINMQCLLFAECL